ncbi:MAG: hypothetical protein D6696_05445 [Acidobacteria bacterium]|nr:MAG: hypothetical protein D6696_05445 [Acidobacteriota bacterium]
MAWIRTIPPAAADGVLKRVYDAALERAGKIWNVISIQSLRPETVEASTDLYLEVMQSPRSPLSRAQREMIATAVSRVNRCGY